MQLPCMGVNISPANVSASTDPFPDLKKNHNGERLQGAKMHALLLSKIKEHGHPICLGFDPDTTDLHPFLMRQFEGLAPESFLERWYDATISPITKSTHSIKFQSAFFEQFGPPGMAALRDVIIDAKRRGLFVILDAKRGDISSTMKAYGIASYEKYQADALTILPWMGTDSLKAILPWLKKGHSCYIVWLSSNTAGRDIQLHKDECGRAQALYVFNEFYQTAVSEGVTRQLGWVLGATSIPSDVLNQLPDDDHAFLLPGIGAQGATFDNTTAELIQRFPASLFPISRGILRPKEGEDIHSWTDYSRAVAAKWESFVTLARHSIEKRPT